MSAAEADVARLLAEAHAARAALATPARAAAVSASALWRHARRVPGESVDFSVARALKTDPDAAVRYRAMLVGVAVAHAPFAIAASDGAIRERRVGAYAITLAPADGDAPPLLVIACGDARVPKILEFVREGEASRLALPEAIGGAIVVALDPAFEDAAAMARDFADPSTEIFLI